MSLMLHNIVILTELGLCFVNVEDVEKLEQVICEKMCVLVTTKKHIQSFQ